MANGSAHSRLSCGILNDNRRGRQQGQRQQPKNAQHHRVSAGNNKLCAFMFNVAVTLSVFACIRRNSTAMPNYNGISVNDGGSLCSFSLSLRKDEEIIKRNEKKTTKWALYAPVFGHSQKAREYDGERTKEKRNYFRAFFFLPLRFGFRRAPSADPAKNKEKIRFFIIERARKYRRARARPFLTFRMRIRNIYLVARSFFRRFCVFRIVESSTLQFIGWLFVRFYGFHFIYLFPWNFARLLFDRCDLHDALVTPNQNRSGDYLFRMNSRNAKVKWFDRFVRCNSEWESKRVWLTFWFSTMSLIRYCLMPVFTLSILIFIALTQKKKWRKHRKKSAQGGEAK